MSESSIGWIRCPPQPGWRHLSGYDSQRLKVVNWHSEAQGSHLTSRFQSPPPQMKIIFIKLLPWQQKLWRGKSYRRKWLRKMLKSPQLPVWAVQEQLWAKLTERVWKCGFRISSINTTWEPARNANSQAPPQAYWIRTSGSSFTCLPGN